jgi:phosphoglycolate phosphatase-like HAD superfamily hydrolase
VIPAFPVYLFDVDGTLVDSAADICGAIRQASLVGTRYADIPDEYLRRYIGRHLIDLYKDLFPEYTPEKVDQLIADYRRIYTGRRHAATRVYDGVPEALARLGGRKSTATTKGTPTTRIVLEQFGLLAFFDHVQGTDGFPAKPEPDVISKWEGVLEVKPKK